MKSTHIALITGGSRGLGKNAALHLGRAGVDVIVTYRTQKDEAAAVVRELESMGRTAALLQLDVAQTKHFEAFAVALQGTLRSRWSRDRFDYLVNNAGTGLHRSFLETTEEAFDELYAQHFKGVYFLTQKLVPLMNDGGKILNVSSGLARFALPGYSAYAAMKGAVEVLTRYLAKELGPRRIAVNTLAPGAIATDFGGGAVRDNPELQAFLSSQTALGRVGMPDDIGGVIANLLSDGSGWINAQRIEASGGFLI